MPAGHFIGSTVNAMVDCNEQSLFTALKPMLLCRVYRIERAGGCAVQFAFSRMAATVPYWFKQCMVRNAPSQVGLGV